MFTPRHFAAYGLDKPGKKSEGAAHIRCNESLRLPQEYTDNRTRVQ